MKSTLNMAMAFVMLMASAAVARESRVERDFRTQKAKLKVTEKTTGEEACRYGGSMKVYRACGEVRKMEWSIGCSNRDVERDFYFSRGKPVLVIEREYGILDQNAEELATRNPPTVKRVWLTDTGGSKSQRALRKELSEHAAELLAKASV